MTHRPGATVQLHNSKSLCKLGEHQETWANVLLNLKTREKVDHGRRYHAQVDAWLDE